MGAIMTKSASRTPGPWHKQRIGASAGWCDIFHRNESGLFAVASTVLKEDATYIVRACNAHDDAVALAKLVLGEVNHDEQLALARRIVGDES